MDLTDLKYNSILLIFGFDEGNYLTDLKNNICPMNKVFIFQPELDIDYKYLDKNILLLNCTKDNFEKYICEEIVPKNVSFYSVKVIDSIKDTYKEIYEDFNTVLNRSFIEAYTFLFTTDALKNRNFENTISNINSLNTFNSLESLKNSFTNIPALIVSAGPSLDKNLDVLKNNKDKLKDFFILACTRTLKALLNENIIPDVVVSLDPADVMFYMVEDLETKDIPLVVYEQSNKKLVLNYPGKKILVSGSTLNVLTELENEPIFLPAGSVAHLMTQIAIFLGCSPICFLGQDLALTKDLMHSKASTFNFDKKLNLENTETLFVNDVFGNPIQTTNLLNLFRRNLEKILFKSSNLEFINSSYGASIENTNFIELNEFLNRTFSLSKPVFNEMVVPFKIDSDSLIKDIHSYILISLEKLKENSSLLKIITENPIQQNIPLFGKVLNNINTISKDKYAIFIESYLLVFLVYIKQKLFNLSPKEHLKNSSDFSYQANTFLNYNIEFENLFLSIEKLFNETIP